MPFLSDRARARRAVYIAAEFLVFLLQNVVGRQMKPGVLPLIPLTVCIALNEGEFFGFFCGMLAGALTDLAAPAPDGVYALLYAALAFAAGAMGRRLLRGTLPAAMLVAAGFTAAALVCTVFFSLPGGGAAGLFAALWRFYLPETALTVLVTPLFYYPCAAIGTPVTVRPGGEALKWTEPDLFSRKRK